MKKLWWTSRCISRRIHLGSVKIFLFTCMMITGLAALAVAVLGGLALGMELSACGLDLFLIAAYSSLCFGLFGGFVYLLHEDFI